MSSFETFQFRMLKLQRFLFRMGEFQPFKFRCLSSSQLSYFCAIARQKFAAPLLYLVLLFCNLMMLFLFLFLSFSFFLQLGILNSFVSGSQTRKTEKDTEIKGTIKYVLIVLLLFHWYILYLSQIHPCSLQDISC